MERSKQLVLTFARVEIGVEGSIHRQEKAHSHCYGNKAWSPISVLYINPREMSCIWDTPSTLLSRGLTGSPARINGLFGQTAQKL